MNARVSLATMDAVVRSTGSRDAPLNVLLLEDSPSDALLVEQQLLEAGCRVALTNVTRLEECVQALRRQEFQVALIDLNLPDSLGIETFEQVHNAAPQLPIVVLSGLEDAELTLEILRKGAQDCLLKREVFGALLGRSIQFAIERQRLSEELEQRALDLGRVESRIRSMLESSADAFVVIGDDNEVVFSNASARSMLGGSIDSSLLNGYAEQLRAGAPVEIGIRLADDTQGYAEVRSISGDWSSAVTGTLLSLRDITERKRIEQAIRDSEHRMRALIEHSSDGIVTTDIARRVNFQSPSMALLTGYTADELAGATLESYVHPEDAARWRQAFDFITKQPSFSATIEWRWRHKDGHWLWLDGVVTNLLDDPSIQGVVINFRDVTQRKRAEEAQLQSQKLESLGTLAGGIAHDFNNILLAISGNAKLALTELPSQHASCVSLKEIEKASARATDLVRRILAFGRQDEPKREAQQLEKVLYEAVSLLRPMLPAAINLSTRFVEPSPIALVDSTQIHQVIVNLVTNSAYAIGDRAGQIVLAVELVNAALQTDGGAPRLPSGQYACISVRDDGCGIPADNLERVFEPFYTTKPRGQGTGLGLSVVHGIMRAHEGGIAVDSVVGRGTVFKLYFPIANEASQTSAPQVAQSAPGDGRRIMYVDDEESLVFLVTRSLQRIGYEVQGFTDAKLALKTLREQPTNFDAVVTDLSMPGMSGFQFGAEVRALSATVPIILTSGYLRPEDREKASQLGISEVILKPDTIDALSADLHQIIAVKHAQRKRQ